MSEVFYNHPFTLTPLSPVHIGCGQDYDPSTYVIENNTLFHFGSAAAEKALSDDHKTKLLQLLRQNGVTGEQKIRGLQQFFFDQRERLSAVADRSVVAEEGVAEIYRKRVGSVTQRERDGRARINQLLIERTAYDPISQRPYVPGSSIKGAIRTALLDDQNDGKSARNRERSRELQERLFGGKFHTDPCRLISISDVHGQNAESVVLLAVNRAKKQTAKETRASKGLQQWLECVAPLQWGELNGELRFQAPGDSVDQTKLPAEPLRWTQRDIADRCNRFYLGHFRREMEILLKNGHVDRSWADAVTQYVNNIIDNPRQSNKFLLRLGRHSGAESITLNGARSIRIMTRDRSKPKYEDEARTLWIASKQATDNPEMLPFGWVLIEMSPDVASPDVASPDGELQQLVNQTRNRFNSWRRSLTDHQQKMRATLQKEQIEREQKKQQQIAAELEHQQEQARVEAEAQAAREQLDKKLANFSAIAAEFSRLAADNQWDQPSGRDTFLANGVIEEWLDKLADSADADLKTALTELLDLHIPGLLADPNKVKGKKKKPVYTQRQRDIAQKLKGQ